MNTAYQLPSFLQVGEPRTSYPYQQSHNKQITRILIHLRDHLRHSFPQLAMPSQWMIRQLVDNATIERDGIVSVARGNAKQGSNSQDWRTQIIELLQIIYEACDVGLDKACIFVHTERLTPLFPNHELFDEWDAYRFAKALLHQLEKDFSC